jgi:phosphatidylinositol alpha-1,6-mannosyltransferase
MPDLLRTYTDLLYVVIGDGPELNRLKAACSKLKIEPHVMFTGRLDGAEKNAYLANCDLFVMPGKIVGEDVEGFGIAYIEAGYFGLPGIASDSGGAGEAILDGKTGMMCDPGNAGELDDRIRTLLDSPELRQTLGQQARQRAMEFLWEKKIREYREALE